MNSLRPRRSDPLNASAAVASTKIGVMQGIERAAKKLGNLTASTCDWLAR